MYFVDRKKVNMTLTYMKDIIQVLEETTEITSSDIGKLALERIAQNVIESILDVGNAMIDGFIMRDPGSYDDIIDILTDEKVILKEMDAPLKEVISLRKALVRDFIGINHNEIAETFIANMNVLKQFPDQVEHYLTHELGPVSAFLPEDKA